MAPLVRAACWALLLFLVPVSGTSPSRKVFRELNCIANIDPLRIGFTVTLPEDLIRTQLRPPLIPILYTSAIPLNPDFEQFREIHVVETRKSAFSFENLRPAEWYYVCIEFENTDNVDMRGNFSTTCALKRTLDKFGSGADGTVSNVQRLRAAGDNVLEFQADVNVNFPMFVEAYLSADGRTNTYYVDRKRDLIISFKDLIPGYNYGRLCFRQTPVDYHYSSMGRTVQLSLESCFLDDLRPQGDPKAAKFATAFSERVPFPSGGCVITLQCGNVVALIFGAMILRF